MQSVHPWPYARVSAHRGAGTMAPENTLEGFRAGLHHGFHAFETDAMLAKDGVPVLMHDERFGRTIRDTRSVPELTSLEIRSLDAGSWFAPQYTGVPPAGFEQAVRWCRANRVWLNIEIKPAKGAELETGRVVGRLTGELYAARGRVGGATQAGVVPMLRSSRPSSPTPFAARWRPPRTFRAASSSTSCPKTGARCSRR